MGAGLAISKRYGGNTEYFKRKVEWERLREYCRVGVGQWLYKISRYLALISMGGNTLGHLSTGTLLQSTLTLLLYPQNHFRSGRMSAT